MINITYAALHMREQTEKTTFSCKDDCTLTKHTRRWTYSSLRYFLIKCQKCLPSQRSILIIFHSAITAGFRTKPWYQLIHRADTITKEQLRSKQHAHFATCALCLSKYRIIPIPTIPIKGLTLGGGGPEFGKPCLCNTCTLSKSKPDWSKPNSTKEDFKDL